MELRAKLGRLERKLSDSPNVRLILLSDTFDSPLEDEKLIVYRPSFETTGTRSMALEGVRRDPLSFSRTPDFLLVLLLRPQRQVRPLREDLQLEISSVSLVESSPAEVVGGFVGGEFDTPVGGGEGLGRGPACLYSLSWSPYRIRIESNRTETGLGLGWIGHGAPTIRLKGRLSLAFASVLLEAAGNGRKRRLICSFDVNITGRDEEE